MRQLLAAVVATWISTAAALAADPVTVTGEGKCGKCSLKETAKCQDVIEVTENGKTTKYYLADNKAAQDYHPTVCKKTVKTTAKGTVEEKEGKMVMTATEVKEAK